MENYRSYAGERLLEIYHQMYAVQGAQNWWPAQSPLEVVIGAVLTQGTAWSNVEKAIRNLFAQHLLPVKESGVFVPSEYECGCTLLGMDNEKLGRLITPSGTYNVKVDKIKAVLSFFYDICGLDFSKFADAEAYPTEDLRIRLLKVYGVGPETADTILLYALCRPTFVVDTYTMRLLERHSLLSPKDERIVKHSAQYDRVRSMIMGLLPKDVALYNDFHAQIVEVCKKWCLKKNPHCSECPLGKGLWNWEGQAKIDFKNRLLAAVANMV